MCEERRINNQTLWNDRRREGKKMMKKKDVVGSTILNIIEKYSLTYFIMRTLDFAFVR